MNLSMGGPMVCVGCGCSELDACLVDGVPCSWASIDPLLCSACSVEAGVDELGPEAPPAPLLYDAFGAPLVLR